MWAQILMVLAVLSLVAGNLIAIAQTDLKRMLAYSAIANVGFILLGFLTAGADGYRRRCTTRSSMCSRHWAHSPGADASRSDFEAEELDDFKGLVRATRCSPAHAGNHVLDRRRAAIRRVLGQAVDHPGAAAAHHVWLATLAVLASVVGAFYYLRMVWFMYFEAGRAQTPIAETQGHCG